MPIEIDYGGTPAGYAAEDAAKGEQLKVISFDFSSSEDGDIFIKRLEGLPAEILNKIPPASRPLESQVDNMLVIYKPDGKAVIYVNEIAPKALIRVKRDIAPGELVFESDIADIARIEFPDGIQIPPDCGLLYLFSIGWRKGLFFDLNPLYGENRSYDLGKLLASMHSYLKFQHIFRVTDSEWDALLNHGWFPFISLKRSSIERLFWSARNDRDYRELVDIVANDFDEKLDARLSGWKRNEFAKAHIEFLERAVQHYRNADYISASALIYPQIEGLMRSFYRAQRLSAKQTQNALADSIVAPTEKNSHGYSMLLPTHFTRYLKEVYFRDFNPDAPVGVSRNTVSHGVATAAELDKKASLVGLLLIDQILYYMRLE